MISFMFTAILWKNLHMLLLKSPDNIHCASNRSLGETETSNYISSLPYENSKCMLHLSLEVNANTALHPTPTALEL